MISRFSAYALLLLIISLSSCVSRKKIVYFNDETGTTSETKLVNFEPKFEVGDLLSVEVTGGEEEVITQFNQPELVRQGNQISSYNNGVPATYGYLIQSDSTINLPIAGKFKVAGLSRMDAVELIEQELLNYLEKPQVSIRILNFKVTILGEVEQPGTFSIPNERITLLEAIGVAGDLKITGKRDNILVIRYEDNIRKEYRVDITKKELFESPVYFLKQNDVVYVEPNAKSRYDSHVMRSAGGTLVGTASLVISTIVLITNLK
jgi:polysaccharide export outer membrane protein